MSDATDLADQAEALKTSFLGLSLMMPVLLDPRLHVLDIYMRYYGQSPDSPVEVRRNDGTTHSSRTLRSILDEIVNDPKGGLGDEVLSFAGMHGAVRVGNGLLRTNLMSTSEPLLQFARHLRNAAAHGNRWHFTASQPAHPAVLRGRQLDASLDGQQAIYGTVGPGEYLDFLDDVAALLRAMPRPGSLTAHGRGLRIMTIGRCRDPLTARREKKVLR